MRRLHNILVEIVKTCGTLANAPPHLAVPRARSKLNAARPVSCVRQIVPAKSAESARLNRSISALASCGSIRPCRFPTTSDALPPLPIHVPSPCTRTPECRERSHCGIAIQLHIVGFPSQDHLDRPQSCQNRATANPEEFRRNRILATSNTLRNPASANHDHFVQCMRTFPRGSCAPVLLQRSGDRNRCTQKTLSLGKQHLAADADYNQKLAVRRNILFWM